MRFSSSMCAVMKSSPTPEFDWADQFAWDFEKHNGWIGSKKRAALASDIRKLIAGVVDGVALHSKNEDKE